MPSRRTRRTLILLTILALLTVIYISTGASSTTTSPLYQKTMKLMQDRATSGSNGHGLGSRNTVGKSQSELERLKEKGLEKLKEAGGVGVTGGADGLSEQASEKLKERLKDAERVAKGNAERKHPQPPPVEGQQNPIVAGQVAGAGVGVKKPAAPQAPAHAAKIGGESKEEGLSDEEKHRLALREGATAELARLLTIAPILVFSKSYCPYSKKAKHILLDNYSITPTPHVIELDLMDQETAGSGRAMQDLLLERTGRRTVPNVLVGGESIGGGDEVEGFWREGRLKEVFEKAGGREVKGVVEKVKWTPPQQHGH